MTLALAALLLLAAGFDLKRQRIPNTLTLAGLLLGLFWHGVAGGWPGLAVALEGIGVAALTLLFWLARSLGAGDVKLLGAVGALMGPLFLMWTLLGTIFAGAILAVATALARGALRGTAANVLLALPLMQTVGVGAGLSGLAAVSRAGRMPLAPAIALGAVFAFYRLHLRLPH